MKRKTLIICLISEIVLVVALALLAKRFPAYFLSIYAFPFAQLAAGIGALSEMGGFFNGIASLLWIGAGLIPVAFGLRLKGGREVLPEKISLFVLGAVVVFVLYGMTNPGFHTNPLLAGSEEALSTASGILSMVVWSFVVLSLVLHIVRLMSGGSKNELIVIAGKLMTVFAFILVAAASFNLTEGITRVFVKEASGLDKTIEFLRTLVSGVPMFLDIYILLSVREVLRISAYESAKDRTQDNFSEPEEESTENDMSQNLVKASNNLSKICCLALEITVGVTAFFNLIQLAVARSISNVNITANIPVISIVFIAIVLLLSRLLAENRKLRDDNNLFI
ncbi:MAG: hypothetical protein K6B75_05840 [Lachnospiraceae bacterium]|nr:hypothetical protein [Lachnospiraceae bacterium]